jgi:hypothetical protein
MSRSHVNADLPAGPPPEVLNEIEAAWERAQDLFSRDFTLHFGIDAEKGRVCAELFAPDGTLADTLSATELLTLACGDPGPITIMQHA